MTPENRQSEKSCWSRAPEDCISKLEPGVFSKAARRVQDCHQVGTIDSGCRPAGKMHEQHCGSEQQMANGHKNAMRSSGIALSCLVAGSVGHGGGVAGLVLL